jgi:uncharacterized protein (TIGR02271 family)
MGPQELVGTEVYDVQGEKLGKVGTVYINDVSHQPEWVTVQTGLFGHKETFVPLAGASDSRGGLTVRWSKAKIKDAPRIDADGRLSERDSMGLYQYYDLPTQRSGSPRSQPRNRPRDETMTRSEERLNVGTERVESGRVRLRKHVVTEEQQVTVPVTHEEVRIERMPADGGTAEIAEDEREVVLHAEKPVVGKETVPVEQVRLRSEQVTEQRKVRDKVRKEQIEVDDS